MSVHKVDKSRYLFLVVSLAKRFKIKIVIFNNTYLYNAFLHLK